MYLLKNFCLVAIFIALPTELFAETVPSSARLALIKQNRLTEIKTALDNGGFVWDAPVFVRIFKQERVLELWLKKGETFSLFKAYPICSYSGKLGPKLREGDQQSPEGFYYVTPSRLNPNSAYHLSFNLGFPNIYDRSHGRSGSYLMVHGNCVSIGCYAMTDPGIEEIYLIAEAALKNGQRYFRTHIFPFRMNEANMAAVEGAKWIDFWRELKPGYDAFEQDRIPPNIIVQKGLYIAERQNP